MPLVSRLMIRLSLLYLLTGAAIGAVLLVTKAYPVYPGLWALLPAHIELMIFGWIIQLTLGVAYWVFPRYLEGEARGNARAALLIPITLNMGICFTVLSGLGIVPGYGMLAGRMFETATVVIFVFLHWNRVKTYRKDHAN